MLVADYWDLEPERVMGAGNKTLEMTIAQQLMEWREKFDPEPQRAILRDAVLAITDDPARAESLVPEAPVKITDSVHDAQLSAGTLMQGLPVAVKTGINHIEYVETLLITLATLIQRAMASGGMATEQQIVGMQNVAQNIAEHLAIIAQDEKEKPRVKQYADQLGQLMNQIKAFAQRLAQQKQKEAQQGGGAQADPEALAKIQASMLQAQQKVEQMKQSHAQKTAQRQVQFEMEEQRRQQEHAFDLQRQQSEMAVDLAAKRAETAANIEATDMETEAAVRQMRKEAAAKPKPSTSEE